jgi:hypothetical protein
MGGSVGRGGGGVGRTGLGRVRRRLAGWQPRRETRQWARRPLHGARARIGRRQGEGRRGCGCRSPARLTRAARRGPRAAAPEAAVAQDDRWGLAAPHQEVA